VVGEKCKSHDTDFVAAAGARQGADDDAVELGSGCQEEPALDGTGGDLHQSGVVGNESQESGHGAAWRGQGLGQDGP